MKISHVLPGIFLIVLSFPSTSLGVTYFERYLMSPDRVIRSASIIYFHRVSNSVKPIPVLVTS